MLKSSAVITSPTGESTCALCGERVADENAVVGERGAVCVECVWMCLSVLEDRGMVRPLQQHHADDDEETSAVFDRPPGSRA